MNVEESTMKKFHKPLWVVFTCLVLFTFACVTINIYFPAEKVESVAGEIVNEIRGKKAEEGLNGEGNSLLQHILIALAPSTAWAQDVTNVSNPTIRALKTNMKARFAQMKPFYQRGALTEGGDGYVSLGNTGDLGLKEKRDLKALVDAENSDRQTLYTEVAKALNIDPGQLNRIAEIFAKEWQKPVR